MAFIETGDVLFAGNAPAMVASIQIDPGSIDGGVHGSLAGSALSGPASLGGRPTIRAYDVTVEEG